MPAPELVEHFFRREYGSLVASLSRRLGVQHLELAEDAAQTALAKALEAWPRTGAPDNPSAWLFRVARNHALDVLRGGANRRRILDENPALDALEPDAPRLAHEVKDDLLRMLFVACDPAVPVESQLAFALKTLCGFSVAEIALRLFTSEANVYKRVSRARARLREGLGEGLGEGLSLELSPAQLTGRLPAVQRALYLLFTEGYLSSSEAAALRRELCEEALRLGALLAEHPAGDTPETAALVALMHLQLARMPGRVDGDGTLLLLDEQDRARWDASGIQAGLAWLARSAEGEVFSRYHAEAGIAAEHCLAPSFDETNWARVVELYTLLERAQPSPLHRLNRAVALAEAEGPDAALALLDDEAPPAWLEGSYQWTAVRADLHRRAGHVDEAARFRARALDDAPSPAIRALLERRLSPSPPSP